MKKVSIINYGCGNYNSIIGMLKKFDCETIVTSSIKDLERSDIIILPGVGTFPHAMKMLKKNNLVNYIKKLKKNNKKKILGICLGMQILTSSSEEIIHTKGLNIIPGKTNSIKSNFPHIGWNKLFFKNQNSKYSILNGEYFYFQHKYIVSTNSKHQKAYTLNSEKITSFVQNNNIVGIQFHPERSQNAGMTFFKIFLDD